MRRPLFALTFVIGALVACRPSRTEPPPYTPMPLDPGAIADAGLPEPPDLSDGGFAAPACANACANLLRLNCGEGRVRPGEDSCYLVCKRAESTEGRVDFKPACIASAPDVNALRACKTYRCTP